MIHPPHVLFAGGGTGGHLFPGIAAADALRRVLPEAQITFSGCGKVEEQRIVAASGYHNLSVPCRPLPKKPWQALRFVSDNLAGFLAARWFLREQRVSLVVGLGSYASAPMVRAAIVQGVPTILLEQNAVPGRVTSWLASSAVLVCTAFGQVREHLKSHVRVEETGNPVRESFLGLSPRMRDVRLFGQPTQRKQLLVLGGSGGAQSLNHNVPRALYKLGRELDDWQVIHQTGAGGVRETQQLYRKLGMEAVAVSFIDNLPEVLRTTDLVICRAGGTTLAELAYPAPAAIVVPYPSAADDHQTENAKVFAAAGACRVVLEGEGPRRLDDRLASAISPLICKAAARVALSHNLQKFARPQAAARVAQYVRDELNPLTVRAAA